MTNAFSDSEPVHRVSYDDVPFDPEEDMREYYSAASLAGSRPESEGEEGHAPRQ